MSDALLRFENVTKSYGDFTVFSDISLEVHEKEVVSIIGSSGSGKTTLLRCINLLERLRRARSSSTARRSAITTSTESASACRKRSSRSSAR